MNAKRLTTALVVAVLVSGLFTFWLSRRVAKANHAALPSKAAVRRRVKEPECGRNSEARKSANGGVAGIGALAGGFTKIADVAGRAVLYPLAKGRADSRPASCRRGRGRGPDGEHPIGDASDLRPLR